MDFVLNDLEEYRQALERAKKLKMTQYCDPLQHIIYNLERIVQIDEDLMKVELERRKNG